MNLINPVRVCAALLAFVLVSCDNQKETSDKPGEHQPVAQADTAYKRYAVKQAHIRYENTGHIRGTEDLYIMDWGRREARYSNLEMLRPEGVMPQQTATITDGSFIIMADIPRRSGNRFREPFLDSLLQLKDPDSPEANSRKVMTDMGFTRAGTDTVLGKITDIWYQPQSGTTMWLWGGVVLKQRVDNPQMQHEAWAISIDTVTPIDRSKFTAPEGLTYIEDRPGPPMPRK